MSAEDILALLAPLQLLAACLVWQYDSGGKRLLPPLATRAWNDVKRLQSESDAAARIREDLQGRLRDARDRAKLASQSQQMLKDERAALIAQLSDAQNEHKVSSRNQEDRVLEKMRDAERDLREVHRREIESLRRDLAWNSSWEAVCRGLQGELESLQSRQKSQIDDLLRNTEKQLETARRSHAEELERNQAYIQKIRTDHAQEIASIRQEQPTSGAHRTPCGLFSPRRILVKVFFASQ